ncbi:hypothetical protein U1Q18_025681 [Sarracenia purpurea var. burkii]
MSDKVCDDVCEIGEIRSALRALPLQCFDLPSLVERSWLLLLYSPWCFAGSFCFVADMAVVTEFKGHMLQVCCCLQLLASVRCDILKATNDHSLDRKGTKDALEVTKSIENEVKQAKVSQPFGLIKLVNLKKHFQYLKSLSLVKLSSSREGAIFAKGPYKILGVSSHVREHTNRVLGGRNSTGNQSEASSESEDEDGDGGSTEDDETGGLVSRPQLQRPIWRTRYTSIVMTH